MRIFFLLMFILSCGSDTTGYDRRDEFPQNEEQGPRYTFSTFETRLTTELKISGTLCYGGEVSETEGRSYRCAPDQWLIVVDDINRCTPEGCTEVEVRPFIGILQRVSGSEVEFFQIAPFIPVRSRVEEILDDVLLRYDGFTDPVVVWD